MNITLAHQAARNQAANAASIALADAGAGNSTLKFYSAEGGTLRATRTLAKPCGVVRLSDGRIELADAGAPDVVVTTGGVGWVEWCSGTGAAIAASRVTDLAGNVTNGSGATVPDPLGVAEFQLGGTAGTMVYTGGLVLLNSVLLG